jgi:hypothetical protein
MAKQTFTTGQVLTAAQMTSLQQTAMGGGSATAKTVSYTLVAADAGATVIMNSASSTTITVNTALFAAGDTVLIVNQGAGVCTVTAGTATVSTAGSLALAQYETGILYFLSTGAAIFSDYTQSGGGGGKVLQVVQASTSTATTVTSTTFTDSTLTATITPTLNTSKVLVMTAQPIMTYRNFEKAGSKVRLMRDATAVFTQGNTPDNGGSSAIQVSGVVTTSGYVYVLSVNNIIYLDSPATTSATTYKTQIAVQDTANTGTVKAQANDSTSTIILMEIGA